MELGAKRFQSLTYFQVIHSLVRHWIDFDQLKAHQRSVQVSTDEPPDFTRLEQILANGRDIIWSRFEGGRNDSPPGKSFFVYGDEDRRGGEK